MYKYIIVIFLIGMTHFGIDAVGVAPTICSDNKVEVIVARATKSAETVNIVARATKSAETVNIDCNLNLDRRHVVTKRLIFEGASASGITVNCNGATLDGGRGTVNDGQDMIEVKSRKYKDTATDNWKWERPENITIKNCNIIGSVRVWGMAQNGEGPDLTESSRSSGHVLTARNNAPKNIIFDKITISGVGRSPLYFSPGVTYSALLNSEIKGNSDSVAIYLDAESSNNTIKNNYIHADTSNDREVMAIDGSSNNKIMNNKFSALDNGGIYLYRNCGQGGTIRHSTPSNNTIINNIFYYDKYTGGNPSVYLGSRNGDKPYCGKDKYKDSPYGSGVSDLDYARYNIVMQNQIYKRSISDMIKCQHFDTFGCRFYQINSPNYIDYNQTVTTETKRLAGCYVSANGYERDFILHGESIDVLVVRNGQPACYKSTCNDGDLSSSNQPSCTVTKSSFDCQVNENNNGCNKPVSCPSGKKIIGATAACNLEFGTISEGAVATLPTNNITVLRESDHVSEGSCYVGSNSLQSGQKTISGIDGLDKVSVGCKEHDSNGGDCHIKGILYCR